MEPDIELHITVIGTSPDIIRLLKDALSRLEKALPGTWDGKIESDELFGGMSCIDGKAWHAEWDTIS